jgi:hypothetical protein
MVNFTGYQDEQSSDGAAPKGRAPISLQASKALVV